MNEINGYWLKIQIEIIWDMRQKNERNIDIIYSSRTQDRILGHQILRPEVHPHITIDFLLMSHNIQWIHRGLSCIRLRSSMSKVSCLQMHNDRRKFQATSWQRGKKIISIRRPKEKTPLLQSGESTDLISMLKWR